VQTACGLSARHFYSRHMSVSCGLLGDDDDDDDDDDERMYFNVP